jgi:hypothetical protein
MWRTDAGVRTLGGSSMGSTTRSSRFRVYARLPTRLRALVGHPQAGWMRHAPVENMGLGGARVLVHERVTPGDAVTMSLTAPTLWDPLVLKARVAWAAPGGPPYAAGIAFELANPEALFALYELISTLGYE